MTNEELDRNYRWLRGVLDRLRKLLTTSQRSHLVSSPAVSASAALEVLDIRLELAEHMTDPARELALLDAQIQRDEVMHKLRVARGQAFGSGNTTTAKAKVVAQSADQLEEIAQMDFEATELRALVEVFRSAREDAGLLKEVLRQSGAVVG